MLDFVEYRTLYKIADARLRGSEEELSLYRTALGTLILLCESVFSDKITKYIFDVPKRCDIVYLGSEKVLYAHDSADFYWGLISHSSDIEITDLGDSIVYERSEYQEDDEVLTLIVSKSPKVYAVEHGRVIAEIDLEQRKIIYILW